MPKYVIERDIPNVGSVTPEQVIAISQKSCSVLNGLGPTIQWLHSYVTQDKIYCVYIAPKRRDGTGARPPGRISRKPRVGSEVGHRSNLGGSVGATQQIASASLPELLGQPRPSATASMAFGHVPSDTFDLALDLLSNCRAAPAEYH